MINDNVSKEEIVEHLLTVVSRIPLKYNDVRCDGKYLSNNRFPWSCHIKNNLVFRREPYSVRSGNFV